MKSLARSPAASARRTLLGLVLAMFLNFPGGIIRQKAGTTISTSAACNGVLLPRLNDGGGIAEQRRHFSGMMDARSKLYAEAVLVDLNNLRQDVSRRRTSTKRAYRVYYQERVDREFATALGP